MPVVANVVCVPFALQFTCDPVTKFVPARVIAKSALPKLTHAGVIDASVGDGFAAGLMIKVIGFDNPLSVELLGGFTAVTVAVPGFATNSAGTVAVTSVTVPELFVVICVCNGDPFHLTTVCFTNPAPLTVNVKPGLPALTFEGDSANNPGPVLV